VGGMYLPVGGCAQAVSTMHPWGGWLCTCGKYNDLTG